MSSSLMTIIYYSIATDAVTALPSATSVPWAAGHGTSRENAMGAISWQCHDAGYAMTLVHGMPWYPVPHANVMNGNRTPMALP